MADAPLPPLTPLGGTPPPLPPSEPLVQDREEVEDIAESLSPLRVLGKTPSTPAPLPASPQAAPVVSVAPVTSAPAGNSGSPFDEVLDENELVQQAAQAAPQPLILPNRKGAQPQVPERLGTNREQLLAAAPAPDLTAIAVKSRGINEQIQKEVLGEGLAATAQMQEAKPLAPVSPPPKPLPEPVSVISPPLPPKPLPAAVPPPLPTGRPPVLQPPVKKAVPAIPLSGVPRRKANPAIAAVGALVAVAVLVGGGYVLALTGARLPVLGSFVSGLPANSTQVAGLGLGFVRDHAPYQYVGISELVLSNSSDASLTEGSSEVFKLRTESQVGTVSDNGTRTVHSATIAANDGAAVPVFLRDTGEKYLVSFPNNTDTSVASLSSDNLHDTLLAPVLRTIPLEVLLAAVQGEQSYQKVDIKGHSASAYTVSLEAAQLADYFPVNATISSATAVVAFAWKGEGVTVAEPLDAQLQATFTYQDKEYQFSSHWQYSNWLNNTPPSELGSLATTDVGTIATDLTSESFVSRLGISFKALPHGNLASSGAPTDTTTRFTPIIPSGDVITVAQTARQSNPPVPTQPATSEGKQRDVQRKQDLRDIQKALEQYKLEKGTYPSVLSEVQLGTNAVLFGALVPNYLTKMPVDPLNTTYFYAYNVVVDASGMTSGYYLRAILEDAADSDATAGQTYTYFQLTNN